MKILPQIDRKGYRLLLPHKHWLPGMACCLFVCIVFGFSSWVQAKGPLHGVATQHHEERAVSQDYSYTTNDGTIVIAKYTGLGGVATIPKRINGLPVSKIGDSAFYACTTLTGVVLPVTVTSIGDAAFRSCTGLGSMTMSTNVTSIGDNAFACCIGLTNVVLPASVTSIGDSAFSYCTALAGITIPEHVARIRYGTFQSCSRLVKVKMHEALVSIDDMAFAYCARLPRVTIPRSVTRIGDMAFQSCSSLKEVYFSGNAPRLGSAVFTTDTNAIVFYLPATTGWGTTFGERPTAVADH